MAFPQNCGKPRTPRLRSLREPEGSSEPRTAGQAQRPAGNPSTSLRVNKNPSQFDLARTFRVLDRTLSSSKSHQAYASTAISPHSGQTGNIHGSSDRVGAKNMRKPWHSLDMQIHLNRSSVRSKACSVQSIILPSFVLRCG